MSSTLPIRAMLMLFLLMMAATVFTVPELILPLNALALLAVIGIAAMLFPGVTLLFGVSLIVTSPENFLVIDRFVAANFSFLGTHALLKLGVLACLAPAVLRCGVRNLTNPAILACGLLLIMSLIFSDLYPGLDFAQMIKSLIAFSMPFLFFSMNFRASWIYPGLLLVALLPIISILLGTMAQMAGVLDIIGEPWVVIETDYWGAQRLGGINIAAHFAIFCYAAIFVCLYLAIIEKRQNFYYLAALNFAFLIFSGTRGPSAAAIIFAAFAILFVSRHDLKASTRMLIIIGGVSVLSALLILYWPSLETRFTGGADTTGVNTSGRADFWIVWWRAFLEEPIFGHGLGAGAILIDVEANPLLPIAAHNEYLRLLVDGGVVGLLIFLGGFILLFVNECRYLNHSERMMILGLMVSFALYTFTDNTLTSPPTIALTFALALITAKSRILARRQGIDAR